MTPSNPDGVHAASDAYVRDYAAADPLAATAMGVTGHDAEMTDFSPEGYAARAEIARRALAQVRAAEPADDAEAVAAAVFAERVGLSVEISDAGLDRASLNVVASPPQEIRLIFDLMPTTTADDWATVAQRLAAVPDALAGLRMSLLGSEETAALRQVRRVAEQGDTWAGASGTPSFFDGLVGGAQVPESLRSELRAAAGAAAGAYGGFGRFLREDLAPRAPSRDAVGGDRYALWSRYFLGAQLDLAEAYAWGWDEFSRLETELREVASRIASGGSMAAAAALDADPRYRVRGQDGLQRWMQQLSDEALVALRGSHFDIPDRLMDLECRIAPPGGGVGAYYTGPDDGFTRPDSCSPARSRTARTSTTRSTGTSAGRARRRPTSLASGCGWLPGPMRSAATERRSTSSRSTVRRWRWAPWGSIPWQLASRRVGSSSRTTYRGVRGYRSAVGTRRDLRVFLSSLVVLSRRLVTSRAPSVPRVMIYPSTGDGRARSPDAGSKTEERPP